jgi:hypothetical protein
VDRASGKDPRKPFGWILKQRFLWSAAGLAIASVALWHGKMDGENWVFALAVVLAGHHAEDLVKAWRK